MRINNRYYNRFALELDVLRWEQQVRRLPGANGAKVRPGRVVFVCGMTMPATAKFESLLANYLAQTGKEIHVILISDYPPTRRIFTAFGNDIEFHFIEPLDGSPDFSSAVQREIESLSRTNDHTAILDYRFRGVDVGRHALSTVMRERALSSIDLGDPLHRAYIKSALEHSIRCTIRAEEMISAIDPEIAVMLEHNYSPQGELFDILCSRNVRTIGWSGMYFEDSFNLRAHKYASRFDYHNRVTRSLFERTLKDGSAPSIDQIQHQILGAHASGSWLSVIGEQPKGVLSLSEFVDRFGLGGSKPIIAVMVPFLYESVYGEGVFLHRDLDDWLSDVVDCAHRNSNANWIFKIHPALEWISGLYDRKISPFGRSTAAVREALENNSNLKVLTAADGINNRSLFEIFDYVVTPLGTAGLEYSCFGIPALTAGKGWYDRKGFTIDSETREEFRAKLMSIDRRERLTEAQINLATRYYHCTYNLRRAVLKSGRILQNADTFRSAALKTNFALYVGQKGGTCRAGDLEAIVRWICDHTSAEYVPGDWGGPTYLDA